MLDGGYRVEVGQEQDGPQRPLVPDRVHPARVVQVPGRVDVEQRGPVGELDQHPEHQAGQQQRGGQPVPAQPGRGRLPARGTTRPGLPGRAGTALRDRGSDLPHRPGAACPPLDKQSARRTVTMVSQRVIRFRGTWVSAAQATAVYQANTQGATRIQA